MAYIYRHIRHDKNEPFYIGIGRDDGGEYKRAYHGSQLRKSSVIWNRIVAKTTYEVEIIIDGISWEYAICKEKEFIKLYGRINNKTGTLANMTDGGEGSVGRVYTDEIREKIGKAWRGKKQTKEMCEKKRIAMTGREVSLETREKLSKANKGKTISQETKEYLRKINKGRPNYKLRGRKHSDEYKQKCRERMIGYSPSPEVRKKISDFQKGHTWNVGRKHTKGACLNMKAACKTKKAVIQYALSGEVVGEYDSQREAATALGNGFRKEIIGRACKGVPSHPNHIYKGYVWKYKQ